MVIQETGIKIGLWIKRQIARWSMSTKTYEELKEAYRLFWMIKGHLRVTPETALGCQDGYFKRLWYDEESYLKEEGFEEAWPKKWQEIRDKNVTD